MSTPAGTREADAAWGRRRLLDLPAEDRPRERLRPPRRGRALQPRAARGRAGDGDARRLRPRRRGGAARRRACAAWPRAPWASSRRSAASGRAKAARVLGDAGAGRAAGLGRPGARARAADARRIRALPPAALRRAAGRDLRHPRPRRASPPEARGRRSRSAASPRRSCTRARCSRRRWSRARPRSSSSTTIRRATRSRPRRTSPSRGGWPPPAPLMGIEILDHLVLGAGRFVSLKERGRPVSRVAYFDCASGASGDMVLGALVDLGLPLDRLRAELAKLRLPAIGWRRARSSGRGCRPPRWTSSSTIRSAGGRATADERDGHAERLDAHDHDHDTTTSTTTITTTIIDARSCRPAHPHRGLREILRLIETSGLDAGVKERSSVLFRRLGEAEASVHGIDVEKVTFHEVGAVDSIVDVVGAVIGLGWLRRRSLRRLAAQRRARARSRSRTACTRCRRRPRSQLVSGVPVYGEGARRAADADGRPARHRARHRLRAAALPAAAKAWATARARATRRAGPTSCA